MPKRLLRRIFLTLAPRSTTNTIYMMTFDLLSTVEYGGCSAKLDPELLKQLLDDIPIPTDARVLVGASTHDDAGVYLLDDDRALIFTTDFFPPVCSDPYVFGRIAAANALSDVYAMGGKPIMALNLLMFPSTAPMEALSEIIRGGQSILDEAGCLMLGGHTIDDAVPKYGLAVVGMVKPKEMMTNSGARVGDRLILTKPLGTGIALAGHRLEMIDEHSYKTALDAMSMLNLKASAIAVEHKVVSATDITGFGLVGHAMQMADASAVTFEFYADQLPAFPNVMSLLDAACIPGAAFRNLRYVGESLYAEASLNHKMLAADAQTSGGLLLSVAEREAQSLLTDLQSANLEAAFVGRVCPREPHSVRLIG